MVQQPLYPQCDDVATYVFRSLTFVTLAMSADQGVAYVMGIWRVGRENREARFWDETAAL